VSEKTGEMRNVATFNTGTTKVTTDVGWSYAPGAAYRPDLARYQGTLQPLAQQELRG
ncbi:TPA: phage head morphogenesis protein, partial [Escherichia coli]|nr:phage head morphogenesis protein [Escherichia coli]HBC5135353.1 phage head morphogenesis protein [Escherichia coli]HDD8460231.1 phage head morphogenesis protein [Escherichia coli]